MKDIPMKRILRYAFSVFICLFFVANFLSNEARAETGNQSGNLTIDAGAGNTYINEGAAAGGGTAFNWTGMFFDTANYNKLSRIDITFESNWAIASDAGSTNVCIIAGGSGCGVVSLSKIDRKVSFYFSPAVEITSTNVELSYDNKAFLDGITIAASIQQNAAWVPTVTEPVRFKSNTGGALPTKCNTNANFGCTFFVSSSMQFVNHYTANYSGNIVNVSIDKSMSTVNSYINISNDTANKFIEGTYDTTGFSYSFIYDTGLAINMTDASGNSDYIILNTTDSTFPAALPTPTIDPLTGVGIMFDAATYSINGEANISWIRTNPTPLLYTDDIYLIQPGNIKKILVSSPPDSGYIKTNDFPVSGEYQVTFERSVLGLNPEILDSDTATVIAEQPSYIIVNSTIPSNYPFNLTWLLGYTPVLQTINNGIEIYQASSGWLVDTCYSSSITANTEYTCTATVPAEGDYKIVLREIGKGNVVTVYATALQQYNPPLNNITTSSLSIDKTTYYRGDAMQIIFEIDNTNYSNYMTYYAFWNTTQNRNVANYKLDGMQSGTVYNVLGSYLDSWDFTRTIVGTGDYNISLMAKNNTDNFVISSVNFSYVDANRRGISMSFKDKTVCTKDSQTINYIITENLTLSIQESATGKIVSTYNISESGTLRYRTTKTGVYLVSLQAGDGTIQALDDYTVSNCEVAPASTPISGAGQAQQVAAAITTPIFWALIITAGLMIAIAWKTRDGFAAGSVGMLSAGVFAFMTWLPLWIFFSVLIIAALLLSSSIVAKQLKKTG